MEECSLYKHMFVPDHQTLAIICCFMGIGSDVPIAEMQCRVAVKVFKVCKNIGLRTRGNYATMQYSVVLCRLVRCNKDRLINKGGGHLVNYFAIKQVNRFSCY